MSLRFVVFCECGISIWGSFVLLVCALSQTQAQANTVGQVLSQDSSWYSPWSTNILQWITRGTVKIFQGKPAQETGDPALGDDCWSSERCQVRTRNSECTEGRCTCKLDYIPDATLRNCIYKNVIGRICGSDADCSQYNSAICSGETCICGLNFINAPSASACLPVSSIGGKCAVDEQCWRVTNLSICDNPTMLCSCPVRYVNDANGKTCLPVKRLDEPCVISEQCLATSPDSTCLKNADGTSICRCTGTNIIRYGSTCNRTLGLGEDCVTGDLCQARVTGSTCDAGSKKCVCEANNYIQFRIPNQTLDTCIPVVSLDGICVYDESCQATDANALCLSQNGEKRCGCNSKNFTAVLGQCEGFTTRLGDTCLRTGQCLASTPGSVCQSGICKCSAGFIPDASKISCQVQKLGDSCVIGDTCGSNLTSTCADGICACQKSGFTQNTCSSTLEVCVPNGYNYTKLGPSEPLKYAWNPYPNNASLLHCICGGGNNIILTINQFVTEACCDYMELRDNCSPTANLIATLRGDVLSQRGPAQFVSSTSLMSVVFKSDESINSGIVNVTFTTSPRRLR